MTHEFMYAAKGRVTTIDTDMLIFQIHPGSVSIDQAVAQWLGRLSNCNVVAQSFQTVASPEGYTFRLFCTECKGEMPLNHLTDIRINNAATAEFCKKHKHILEPEVELKGRKIREEL